MINDVLNKIRIGERLERSDVIELLKIENGSAQYEELLALADSDARKRFKSRGQIYAQIGINAAACPADCAFCSLAEAAFKPENSFSLSLKEIKELASEMAKAGADEIFLMCTANYSQRDFISAMKAVREVIPAGMRLVANAGDFNYSYAEELKAAGVTGAYHIRRLGEGLDTKLSPESRVDTLKAIRAAGLELYYCVEPIGPEHSYDEIADEIMRGQEFSAAVMAVMKRVCVPGTRLYERGEIDSAELSKICAVAELAVKPARAMGVHEPDENCLHAGANQIYAELSVNPRDLCLHTEKSRGASVEKSRKMLSDANWKI